MTNPIPEGFHTLVPTIAMKDARKAIEFYKKAFGAEEKLTVPHPNGQGVAHAEIKIGDSIIMLGDETPGSPCKSVETVGQATAAFALYVPNVDDFYKKAVAAGATGDKPVADMYWGDRCGSVCDPFGQTWWILTHIKDVSQEDMVKGAAAEKAEKTPTVVSVG